jgi:hypothetical protein
MRAKWTSGSMSRRLLRVTAPRSTTSADDTDNKNNFSTPRRRGAEADFGDLLYPFEARKNVGMIGGLN